jgi:hypothetical protein
MPVYIVRFVFVTNSRTLLRTFSFSFVFLVQSLSPDMNGIRFYEHAVVGFGLAWGFWAFEPALGSWRPSVEGLGLAFPIASRTLLLVLTSKATLVVSHHVQSPRRGRVLTSGQVGTVVRPSDHTSSLH